jgi:hypothetical protein
MSCWYVELRREKHKRLIRLQYVVGGADENEILLFNTILALRDSLNILLKYVLEVIRPR